MALTHSLPVTALVDRSLADWVRAHGVSVTAQDDQDLDLVQRLGLRPFQVVCRCGPRTTLTRRAVGLGVRRFIVCTAHQMARLDECAGETKYLYLDDQAPLLLGDRRLKVIGLHAEVPDADDVDAWARTAAGLVRRVAVLRACGTTVQRIALSGGTTGWWPSDLPRATAIGRAVDGAVRGECDQRQLPVPRVTVLTRGNGGAP